MSQVGQEMTLFFNETAINGRFVGVWEAEMPILLPTLPVCVCFVTPDNTEMTAHLAA